MTTDRFLFIQSDILGMNGKQLATLLGVSPSAVARWANGTDIPDYIEKHLELLAADKLSHLSFPLTLTELFALSRLAEARHTTVEHLLVALIRRTIATPPDNIVPLPLPEPSARVADDPVAYTTGPAPGSGDKLPHAPRGAAAAPAE